MAFDVGKNHWFSDHDEKRGGDKFVKDQNLDLKSDTCTGSCDDNIVEIQYIYIL